MRRRDERMLRPARVRIRRRKPWVLCRRRLFGWYVRLLNVFTPLKGAWLTVRNRVVSCEQSPVVSQLAPLTHERPDNDWDLPWTCGTGRRRSRPANGTCCASAGSIRTVERVARAQVGRRGGFHRLDRCCGPYLCKTPQNDTTQACSRDDTPTLGEIDSPACGQLLIHRRGELYVQSTDKTPQHDQSANAPTLCRSNSSVTTSRVNGQGYLGRRTGEDIKKGYTGRDVLSISHNLWTKVWILGALGSDTTGHSQKKGV